MAILVDIVTVQRPEQSRIWILAGATYRTFLEPIHLSRVNLY